MIPKKIIYCWFGKNEKPELVLACIRSWKKHLNDYDFLEINEDNFDVNSHPYTKKAFQEKKWAFISDYARLKFLEKEGGVYLDTDMFVVRKFNDFLGHTLVLGKEDGDYVSAGMIAAEAHSDFIKQSLQFYDHLIKDRDWRFVTIPRIITSVYEEYIDKKHVKVFESKYFYPFNSENIKYFNYENTPAESYAVHLWNYSWGSPIVLFFKKIGIYKYIKKYIFPILEFLSIKNFFKKIFKII